MEKASNLNSQNEPNNGVTIHPSLRFGDNYVDGICCLTVLFAALFFGWLLTLAYPLGLWNGESLGYLLLGKDFRWFAPNSFDWWRTIPFAAVLNAALTCRNPTQVIFWLNTGLFAVSSALVFCLGRALFNSRWRGLALAIVALVFEVTSMRVFYNDLQVSADPFFAQLIYLGVLLALIGWLRRSAPVYLIANAVLGVAAFTKSIGVTLLPEWIAFALLSWQRWPGGLSKKLIVTALGALLLSAPVTLWWFRNLCIYGQASVASYGGSSLLLASLPLLQDNDRLFDEAKTNSEFIISVRTCEKESKIVMNADAAIADRVGRYESYFLWCKGPAGPFDYLARVTNPKWDGDWITAKYDSVHMFKIAREAGRIAERIIWLHPWDYIKRGVREYTALYNPLLLNVEAQYCYHSDPSSAYRLAAPYSVNEVRLFPGAGMSGRVDNAVAAMISTVVKQPLLVAMFDCYFANEFILSHFIFLVAVFSWVILKRRSSKANEASTYNVAIVLIMLFLTASLNYLVTAISQVARMRYALAGELELHLMFLIVLLQLAKSLGTLAVRRYPSSQFLVK